MNMPVAPWPVSGMWTGDGLDDILVSAYGAKTSWLIFGRETGFGEIDLDDLGTGGVTITGGPTARYTDTVQSAGDVNGDGYDDFLIQFGTDDQAALIFGKAGGWTDLDLNDLGTTGLSSTVSRSLTTGCT